MPLELRLSFTPTLADYRTRWEKLRDTGLYEGAGRIAQRVRDILLAALKDAAPKKTGSYADAIDAAQTVAAGSVHMDFTAPDPLSTWIISGTAPHDIYPVSASALRWVGSDGHIHFAKHVSHPGTKPNDFVRRAWEAVQPDVQAIQAATLVEVVKDALG